MYMINFDGEVTGPRVELLLEVLNHNYGTSCVLINSPGGTFEFFSRIAPPLARSGFVSVGLRVASAAVILQLLGRERLALPESTFFFHQVQTILGQRNEVTVCDLEYAEEIERELSRRWQLPQGDFIKRWHDQLLRGQAWMLRFISEQTGLPQALFVKLMRDNVTLSAREAVQYGIVHRVISEDELQELMSR